MNKTTYNSLSSLGLNVQEALSYGHQTYKEVDQTCANLEQKIKNSTKGVFEEELRKIEEQCETLWLFRKEVFTILEPKALSIDPLSPEIQTIYDELNKDKVSLLDQRLLKLKEEILFRKAAALSLEEVLPSSNNKIQRPIEIFSGQKLVIGCGWNYLDLYHAHTHNRDQEYLVNIDTKTAADYTGDATSEKEMAYLPSNRFSTVHFEYITQGPLQTDSLFNIALRILKPAGKLKFNRYAFTTFYEDKLPLIENFKQFMYKAKQESLLEGLFFNKQKRCLHFLKQNELELLNLCSCSLFQFHKPLAIARHFSDDEKPVHYEPLNNQIENLKNLIQLKQDKMWTERLRSLGFEGIQCERAQIIAYKPKR